MGDENETRRVRATAAVVAALFFGCSVERDVPLSDFSCSVVGCQDATVRFDAFVDDVQRLEDARADTGPHDAGLRDARTDASLDAAVPDASSIDATGQDAAARVSDYFPFTLSSVSGLAQLRPEPAVVLDCAGAIIDTTSRVFLSLCGPTPTLYDTTLAVQRAVVIFASGFTLGPSTRLRVVGNWPIILLVDGDATIEGTIDVSSGQGDLGAGANFPPLCASPLSFGTNGLMGSGGGGGGFGTRGERGGDGSNLGGPGGVVAGSALLDPIRAGCGGGGQHPPPPGPATPGGGGGAIQLSVSGRLTIADGARLLANGGGGAGGVVDGVALGGSGGGSGGAILLEADVLEVGAAFLMANGGGGGGGATPTGAGVPGQNGLAELVPAQGGTTHGGAGAIEGTLPVGGAAAVSGVEAGGGGGGGLGRIRLNARACTLSSSVSASPLPSLGGGCS
ncbi:MAG: hypothetical protein HY791_23890 [Deltaproteobacteria bacterium]|nr:hypothetical protein [Deltaproteobacteria bacterium]